MYSISRIREKVRICSTSREASVEDFSRRYEDDFGNVWSTYISSLVAKLNIVVARSQSISSIGKKVRA